MSDLESKFATAANDAKQLTSRPDNADLLKMYALYKQATDGDVGGKRPGALSAVNRAKYDAWADVAGTSSDDAKQAYVDLVERLKN